MSVYSAQNINNRIVMIVQILFLNNFTLEIWKHIPYYEYMKIKLNLKYKFKLIKRCIIYEMRFEN